MRPLRIAAALNWTGLVRAISARAGSEGHEPREVTRAKAAYASTSLGAMIAEADGFDSTLADVAASHHLGDRPLVVLTAGAPPSQRELTAMKMTPAQGKRRWAIWKTMQDEEATWSSRSQHSVVSDATHYIQFDRPDVVIAAVRSVIDSVRSR